MSTPPRVSTLSAVNSAQSSCLRCKCLGQPTCQFGGRRIATTCSPASSAYFVSWLPSAILTRDALMLRFRYPTSTSSDLAITLPNSLQLAHTKSNLAQLADRNTWSIDRTRRCSGMVPAGRAGALDTAGHSPAPSSHRGDSSLLPPRAPSPPLPGMQQVQPPPSCRTSSQASRSLQRLQSGGSSCDFGGAAAAAAAATDAIARELLDRQQASGPLTTPAHGRVQGASPVRATASRLCPSPLCMPGGNSYGPFGRVHNPTSVTSLQGGSTGASPRSLVLPACSETLLGYTQSGAVGTSQEALPVLRALSSAPQMGLVSRGSRCTRPVLQQASASTSGSALVFAADACSVGGNDMDLPRQMSGQVCVRS